MSTEDEPTGWMCDCGAHAQAETCPVCGWTHDQQSSAARQPGRKARIVVAFGTVLALASAGALVAITVPTPEEAVAIPESSGPQCENAGVGGIVSPEQLSEHLLDLKAEDYEIVKDSGGLFDIEDRAGVMGDSFAGQRPVLESLGFTSGAVQVGVAADNVVLVDMVFQFSESANACRYAQVQARLVNKDSDLDVFPIEGVPDSVAYIDDRTDAAEPYYQHQVIFPKGTLVFSMSLVQTGNAQQPRREEFAELAREQLAQG